MRVLISGAFGYIGSNLTRYLLEQGVEVGALVYSVPEEGFEEVLSKIPVYTADISKPITVKLKEEYDIFIHLAAANDVVSKNDPHKALEVTTWGTRNCLEFCVENKIKKFMYFSTFHVYGKSEGDIDEETALTCKNDYAITHFLAEEYVKMYHETGKIEYVIARPTNIFGSPENNSVERWSLVPITFCKEAFEQKSITLASSGKQKRDFIDLDGLSQTVHKVCKDFELFKNEIYNFSKEESISIREMAKKVKEEYENMFGETCELIVKSEEPKEVGEINVSNKKLREKGYKYTTNTTLIEEIRKTFKLLQSKKG